ncbi:MAG: hypothetical protein LC774_09745, partial [Acidobacteria bacterium]|nr:hypothetical protein [Acidobacteriota bacterium]
HWSVGLLFVLFGLLFTLAAARTINKSPELIKPFRGPILAMEFARTREQVANIFEEAGAQRRAAEKKAGRQLPPDEKTIWDSGRAFVREMTTLDQKFVIPLYLLVFSAAAILVFWCAPQKLGLAAHVAGLVLCVSLVGVAAGLDVRENVGTFDVLDATKGMDRAQILAADLEPTLARVVRSSTTKFALLFAVLLVLALPVAWRGGWGSALAALFAASALFGLASLTQGLHRFIEPAFVLMCSCLLLSGLWMIWLPRAS